MMMAEVLKITKHTVHILQNAEVTSNKMVDEKEAILGPIFHTLSHGAKTYQSVVYKYLISTHKVFQTPKLPFLATEWIEPCEGAWKTEPENGSFTSVGGHLSFLKNAGGELCLV